jgi:hypothetical protein
MKNTGTRSAAIYLGEDRIVIEPHDKAVSGLCVGSPQVRCLNHRASVEEILAALEQTLAVCRTGIPHPNWKDKTRMQPLLVASGEKTWHAVSVSFAYVGVTDTGNNFDFYCGFPEKGAFLFQEEAHWAAKRSKRAEVVAAFRAAAKEAIDAQSLRNPPPLPLPSGNGCLPKSPH